MLFTERDVASQPHQEHLVVQYKQLVSALHNPGKTVKQLETEGILNAGEVRIIEATESTRHMSKELVTIMLDKSLHSYKTWQEVLWRCGERDAFELLGEFDNIICCPIRIVVPIGHVNSSSNFCV